MIYLQTALLAAMLALLVLILRKVSREVAPPVVNLPAPLVNVSVPAPVVNVASAPPAEKPAEVAPSNGVRQPSHVPPSIWDVCQKINGHLIHSHHVRDGSPRHLEALRTPGVYLRRGDEIVEGK